MKAVWELVLHENAWRTSESLTARERLQLKTGLRALASNALQKPDAERRSPTGRVFSIKYIGRFRVVYWPDPFSEELRIVEIESVSAPQ